MNHMWFDLQSINHIWFSCAGVWRNSSETGEGPYRSGRSHVNQGSVNRRSCASKILTRTSPSTRWNNCARHFMSTLRSCSQSCNRQQSMRTSARLWWRFMRKSRLADQAKAKLEKNMRRQTTGRAMSPRETKSYSSGVGGQPAPACRETVTYAIKA
jgi:hypothetical protein